MHLNARFNAHGDENKVVCNSYQGGNWCGEVREGGFPFRQGEEFTVSPETDLPAESREATKPRSDILVLLLQMNIEFTPAEFLVKLSDGSVIHFPNRVGAEKYTFFNFDGDVRIKGIDIK